MLCISELLKANTKTLHFKFRKINENRKLIDEYFMKWSTKEQTVTDQKSSEQDTPSNESILVNSSLLLTTEDSVQYARNNGDGVELSERIRSTIDLSSKDNKNLRSIDSNNLHALQVKFIQELGDKVKAKSSLKGGNGWYRGIVKSRQSSKPLDKRYSPVNLYSIQFQDGQVDLNVH